MPNPNRRRQQEKAASIADKYFADDKKPPKKRVVKKKQPSTRPKSPSEDSEATTVGEYRKQLREEREKSALKAYKKRIADEQKPLTAKQLAFVYEYSIDLNGTQAAIRAGFAEKSANVTAAQLLTKPNIQLAVRKEQERKAKEAHFDADKLLGKLVGDVTADIADLYDEGGNVLPVEEWPMPFRQGLVKEVTHRLEYETIDGKRTEVGRVQTVKLHDRIRQMQLIGRHIGIQAFATGREAPREAPEEPLNDLRKDLAGSGLRVAQPTGTTNNEPKVIEGTVKARTAPRGKKIIRKK